MKNYAADILKQTGKNIDARLQATERLSFQITTNRSFQELLEKDNRGTGDEIDNLRIHSNIITFLESSASTDADITFIQVTSLSGSNYFLYPSKYYPNTLAEKMGKLDEAMGRAVWFETEPKSGTIVVGRVINSVLYQKKIGYLLIYLKESALFEICESMDLLNNGEVYIINREGGILSSRDKSLIGRNLFQEGKGITPDHLKENFDTVRNGSGASYIASRIVNNGDWRVVANIPTTLYERDIINLRNLILVIGVVCCLLAFLISILFSESISRPLRNLSSTMEKVGKGNFNVSITPESGDEIGELSNHFNNMVKEVQRLIQVVYQEQYLKQKAELKSLRMQINPHFLYNTLESINWMARKKDAPEIGDMVKALGDLMRASIGGEDFVTLKDEVENISNYLMIQKFRYRDRFEAFIHISGVIERAILPKLVLQPIVENAIVHGLEKKIGKGRIIIESTMYEGKVTVLVSDNGIGMDREKVNKLNELFSKQACEAKDDFSDDGLLPSHTSSFEYSEKPHTHLGLMNVDRRLKLYYGEEYGITITSSPDEGTCVKIQFPLDLLRAS